MIKDNNISLEEFLSLQETGRTQSLKTNSFYKQNQYIRQHLAKILLHDFKWNFWVTFTFGYKPDLEEVEDILYKLHYRIDRRLVKHLEGKSFLTANERSEWILFPELGGRGLHYHGFIKFNVRPNNQNSYFREWHWLDSALKNTLPKLEHLLSNESRIGFKHYDRRWSSLDQLKAIIYSLKEYGKDPNRFDRFAYTIVSALDWKPKPINQHRSTNKIDEIEVRPNGFQGANSLERFLS